MSVSMSLSVMGGGGGGGGITECVLEREKEFELLLECITSMKNMDISHLNLYITRYMVHLVK